MGLGEIAFGVEYCCLKLGVVGYYDELKDLDEECLDAGDVVDLTLVNDGYLPVACCEKVLNGEDGVGVDEINEYFRVVLKV